MWEILRKFSTLQNSKILPFHFGKNIGNVETLVNRKIYSGDLQTQPNTMEE